MTGGSEPGAARPSQPGSTRALLVLGTAAQSPTAERAANAMVLRWDRELILLDPGEGAQRQLAIAGVSAAHVDRVCITHLHGDHCLGLPGFVERRALDQVRRPLHVHVPAQAEHLVRNLLSGTEFDGADVRVQPVGHDGVVADTGDYRVVARALDHTVPAVGYRIEEPDGRHLLPGRLDALGLRGEAVGRLQHDGELEVDGRRVSLDDVSVPRPGQRFALIMDTRLCPGATALAADTDLLVCESTYVSGEEDLAARHGHLTAAQAAGLARAGGARRLALTHYSTRHPDPAVYEADARSVFPATVAARDLTWVPIEPRPRPTG
jgi:ribonuclease Z